MRLVRTAWGLLVASPARLVVLVAGSVAVALAASSVVLAASSSLASVQATVDAGWRGSYDILVLPADFELRQVDGRSVVPANYLGARSGGITREQWETVLAVPDVEVAAPAATLGWVRDAAQAAEMIPKLALLRSGDVFRVTVSVWIGGEETLRQLHFFAGRAPSAPDPDDDNPVIHTVTYLTPYLDLATMPAAWTQVVGVDPVQENRLVGLRSYVAGGYLTRRVGRVFDEVYDREAVSVPVLLADTAVPGSLRVRVDRVAGVTPADAEVAFRQARARTAAAGRRIGWRQEDEFQDRVVARLVSTRGRVSEIHDARAPLSRFVQPLSSDLIQLTRQGRLLPPDDASGGGCGAGRNVVLLPGYQDYEVVRDGGDRLRLAPVGTWSEDVQPVITRLQPGYFCAPTGGLGGDEAVYRELTVDKPRHFQASAVGSYDLDRLSGEVASAANYVPLGVYAEAPRRLVENAQGEETDRVLVSSPFNPGGLNPPPPTGLTNLGAVEALRGPRFIDAIRVRVGGIAGYSPQALTRIENVAGAIVERTGLQVLVVAGSSPLEVEVEVPGVGVVAERWTTLGTVTEIVSGAEGTSGVLLAASLGVAVGYLLVAGVFVVVDQRQSLQVLTRVGWRRRSVRSLVGWQAAILGAASGVLAVLALGGLRLAGAAQLPWWSLGVVLGGVLVAHVLATVAVAAGWAATRRRGGTGRGGMRIPGPPRGVGGLAWRHVVESPLRLVGVAVVVAVAVSLAAFVAAAVLAFGGRLQQTVLGELVAVRIGGYHVLAAGAAMFAAAAIALYVALLTVERRVALLGLLRALGWRAGQVRWLVTVEAAAPVLAGGLLGMAAAALIAALTGLWEQMLTVAAVGLVLTTAVAVAALRAPVAAALRMVPGITLRAEGATGAVPALATRATLAVVGVLTLALGAASLGWSAARPTAIPAGAFITPPPPPAPPSPAELRIRADVKHLAGLGERTPGSRALTQARRHVRAELEQAGYSVAEQPFVVPRMDLLDAAGRPVLDAEGALVDPNRNDTQVGFLKSLAYDPPVVAAPGRSYPLTLADATTSTGVAGVRCTAGVVVLRIDIDAQAVFAHRLLDRCRGKLAAVMTVRVAANRAWAKLRAAAVEARLPVEHQLIASPPLPTGPDTPMLVATLESNGPGATQSAAPVAVALEAARSAADQDLPLDVAFIVPSHGEIATLVRHQWETRPAAPLVFLGPMGGDIALVAGTSQPVPFDAATVRTTLLSPVAADPASTAWIKATGSLLDRATSPTLLHTLAEHTDVPIPDYGDNVFALAVGLDAGYLGEPFSLSGESIAGSPVDTPDQVDYPTLTELAAGLATLPATTSNPAATPSPTR